MKSFARWTPLLGFLVVSCGLSCSTGFDFPGYQMAVKSGFAVVPHAQQMERLFGDADHFITHFGSASRIKRWSSQVFFAGRYRLTVQVDVMLAEDGRRVIGISGEPDIHLHEIQSVTTDANGQLAAQIGEQWTLTSDDWIKLVESEGDFNAVGLTLDLDNPTPGFQKFVAATRKDRIKVPRDSPDAKE
jgi:hypothetical protein